MPIFEYDLSVIGVQNVERALASIEKRFVQHSRTIMGTAARAANTPALRSAARMSGGRTGRAALDAETAAAARGFREIARVGQTADRQRYREQQRLERDAQRLRMQNIREESRAAQKAQREFRARVGSGLSRVGQSAMGVGKAALAVTGIGGGAVISSRLGSAISLERQQRELAVAGSGQMSLGDIRSKIKSTSIATGASQEDVTQGLREYVSATGNLGEASQAIQSFATIAQAAGASVSDVSKAGAYLTKSMGISAKELPEALSKLYFQGKKGAFELKDIASAIPALGAQASTLGLSGMSGMTTLGGLAQIAQTGTGNAAEAQTALQSLFKQLVAKAGDVQTGKAFGKRVEVFEGGDPTKNMKDIRGVLANIIAASRGDVTKLNEFADIRGSKALNPLVGAYKAAADATKGTDAQKIEAGRQAVLKMIQDNADAQGTYADVQKDASTVMESFSSKLEVLNTKLTDIAGSQLMPALEKLGPPIEKLIPYIAKATDVFASLLDEFASHPIAGLGALIVAKVGADLAAASIGESVKKALTNLITGNGGGGAPGGTPGAGTGMGTALGVLGLGLAGFGAGAELGKGTAAKFINPALAAVQTTTDLAEGTLTDRGEMIRRRAVLGSALERMQSSQPGAIDTVLGGASKLMGGKSAGDMRAEAIQDLSKAIGKLNVALDANTSATNGTALNRGNSPAVPKGAG